MKKNLLTKLSVLALVGLMTFTGCSKIPMLKEDLKDGDVYVSNIAYNETSEEYNKEYKGGTSPYVFNTEAKYNTTTTIDGKDKDGNTDISVKYDNYSVSYSCPDSDYSEFISQCNKESLDESKKINSLTETLKGKIDSNGILFEKKPISKLENSDYFVTSNLNFLSGAGKLGFIKKGDTWESLETFTSSNNEVLDVTYKMKCTKIDDNKIYITGVGKASKNGTTYDGKLNIEVSRENVLVSKFTVDLTLSEPGDSGNSTDKITYKMHEVSETTKKK